MFCSNGSGCRLALLRIADELANALAKFGPAFGCCAGTYCLPIEVAGRGLIDGSLKGVFQGVEVPGVGDCCGLVRQVEIGQASVVGADNIATGGESFQVN